MERGGVAIRNHSRGVGTFRLTKIRAGAILPRRCRTGVRHAKRRAYRRSALKQGGETHMAFSRRSFLRWAASVSTLAVASPRGAGLLDLRAAESGGFSPTLLPSEKEVWDQLVWMAK